MTTFRKITIFFIAALAVAVFIGRKPLDSISREQVDNLSDISVSKPNPLEKDNMDEIVELFKGKVPLIFLDYDGTLIPYTHDPSKGNMSPSMKDTLKQLTDNYTVSIITGRDASSIKSIVTIENIYFSCCHGLETFGPNNSHYEVHDSKEFAKKLDVIEKAFNNKVQQAKLDKFWSERKKFAFTVHYDKLSADDKEKIEAIAKNIVESDPDLKCTFGKDIFDIQSKKDKDWHKGKALEWLKDKIKLTHEISKPIVAIYIGDDVSDEDAFGVLVEGGIGVAVHNKPKETKAKFRLRDVSEVEIFLNKLNSIANSNQI